MAESHDSPTTTYDAKFAALRGKLTEALGTDTVDVLLERAVREVMPVYPGFRLHRDDGGPLRLSWEEDSVAEHSEDYIRSAFSGLYAALLIILAKLLGKEIAVRLASALDADRVLQGQQIAPP
ncbi:MAG: hypothetical protein WD904_10990 [Dehalococcoidia bacterium]